MRATEQQKRHREAQHRLSEEVRRVMNSSEHEGLHWTGTRVDLMEALHVAYLTGDLTDEWGIMMTFNSIVRRVCRVLHVQMPSNPYEMAARGSHRKGMQMNTYMERYTRLLEQTDEALWTSISRPISPIVR